MHRQVSRTTDVGLEAGRAGGASARQVPTVVRLSSSQARVADGQPLALLAQVRPLDAAALPPSGTVLFHDGDDTVGAAELDDAGQARLDGLLLTPGVHALTATFAGGPWHAAAASAPVPQTVTAPVAQVVVLVSAPTAVRDGVLLDAELLDPGTGRLAVSATGDLAFHDGVRRLASAPLVDGRARVQVGAAPEAELRVTYDGDTEHAPAEGVRTEEPGR